MGKDKVVFFFDTVYILLNCFLVVLHAKFYVCAR